VTTTRQHTGSLQGTEGTYQAWYVNAKALGHTGQKLLIVAAEWSYAGDERQEAVAKRGIKIIAQLAQQSISKTVEYGHSELVIGLEFYRQECPLGQKTPTDNRDQGAIACGGCKPVHHIDVRVTECLAGQDLYILSTQIIQRFKARDFSRVKACNHDGRSEQVERVRPGGKHNFDAGLTVSRESTQCPEVIAAVRVVDDENARRRR
jgi:hypothetical protein